MSRLNNTVFSFEEKSKEVMKWKPKQIEWLSIVFIGGNSCENTNEINDFTACNAWLR